jgi:hypothetical protein
MAHPLYIHYIILRYDVSAIEVTTRYI